MDKVKYFLKSLLQRIKDHHIESFSAQIAYFVFLSIFPYLILLFMFITKLSLSYVNEMEVLYSMIPSEAANIIKDFLSYSSELSTDKILSPLVIVSIWVSSNATLALMKSFNIAYNIVETRNYFYKKIIGIIATLITIVLIVIALFIPSLLILFLSTARQYVEIPEMSIILFNIIRRVISISSLFIVLGSLYIILPNKKIAIKSVIPGTVFSVLGLGVISYFFSYFVTEYSRYSLVYGGIAAVIILLVWLFLCGMILMLGGEINSILDEMKEFSEK